MAVTARPSTVACHPGSNGIRTSATPAAGATTSTPADCVPVHANDVVPLPDTPSDGGSAARSRTSARWGSNPLSATARSAVSGDDTERHVEKNVAIGGGGRTGTTTPRH